MSAICAVHQPNLFPWFGFFHKLAKSDIFVLLDTVQFTRRSWNSRVYIKSGAEKAWLTCPTVKVDRGALLCDVEIVDPDQWYKYLEKRLHHEYGKAPFFEESYRLLKDLLNPAGVALSDYNSRFVMELSGLLGISTSIKMQSELGSFSDVSGTEQIIEICKGVNADTYLCGDGSDGYIQTDLFSQNNLNLKFQNFRELDYRSSQSARGLSILDHLFFLGIVGVKSFFRENYL